MNIGVIGINYKSADLRVRECLIQVSSSLLNRKKVSFSFVPLLTCNRIEFYFEETFPRNSVKRFYAALAEDLQDFQINLNEHAYFFSNEDCFIHLVKVTSGLDSILVGETEIQGQVKRAYAAADLGPGSRALHFMFQKALKIAKDIRRRFDNTAIGDRPSMGSILFEIMERSHKTCIDEKILFIGYSRINRRIADFLRSKGLHNLTVCSSNESLAFERRKYPYKHVCSWEDVDVSERYGVIVCGTKKYNINRLFSRLNYSENTLVFDIGMPRLLDPSIESEVRLFNMDFINTQSVSGKTKIEESLFNDLQTKITADVFLQIRLFEKKNDFRKGCLALN
ncbi:MAG: hypothetical protein RSB82_00790 [Victivallaceae bacterium]